MTDEELELTHAIEQDNNKENNAAKPSSKPAPQQPMSAAKQQLPVELRGLKAEDLQSPSKEVLIADNSSRR